MCGVVTKVSPILFKFNFFQNHALIFPEYENDLVLCINVRIVVPALLKLRYREPKLRKFSLPTPDSIMLLLDGILFWKVFGLIIRFALFAFRY